MDAGGGFRGEAEKTLLTVHAVNMEIRTKIAHRGKTYSGKQFDRYAVSNYPRHFTDSLGRNERD